MPEHRKINIFIAQFEEAEVENQAAGTTAAVAPH